MLPQPFFVLATQNPIEQEGTYPLPEAQLDRFSMKVLVDFPTREELKGIVGLTENYGNAQAEPVLDANMLLEIQQIVQSIPIADAVMDKILDIVMATHLENKYIREGVSPRAAQNMIRCSRARAFMNGRLNVAFEDVEAVMYSVLRHRIITSFDAVADGVSEDTIIRNIVV
jgi:MoxR-like ATPase